MFCTISDPVKSYSRCIPELADATIWTVEDGWCLLCNDKYREVVPDFFELLLWNPRTLEKISLPPLQLKLGDNKKVSIGDPILSSSPTATDQHCLVLFLLPRVNVIFYCQLGDKKWTKVSHAEELTRFSAENGIYPRKEANIYNPVFCDGCLYAEVRCHWEGEYVSTLVVIEKLGPEGLKMNQSTTIAGFRTPAPQHSSVFTRKLLESKGELFRIEILHGQDLERREIVGIDIHKLDFSRMTCTWKKVESIKDRVFFVSSHCSSFVCPAINAETEGGRMYVTLANSNLKYIYNIEDNSLMVLRPSSSLPQKVCLPIWLMTDVTDLRMTDSKPETNKEELEKVQIDEMHLKETRDTTTGAVALPVDLAERISERLNIFDYLAFRATDRVFRSAAPRPLRSSSIMERLDNIPLFVCIESDNILTLVHPKHGLNYKYSINLPEVLVGGCTICYSKYGWLLMAAGRTSSLYNPLTKQVLPLMDRDSNNTQCFGFTGSPTSSRLEIIELKNEELDGLTFLYAYDYDNSWGHPGHWRETRIFSIGTSPLYGNGPTWYRGAFYYFDREGNLGVLKRDENSGLIEEYNSWKILETPAPCTGYYKSFLLKCDGNLLSVFEGLGKWVRVFRLNRSTKKWNKIENLGHYMLFVSHTSSFSAVANIPGMENKIYFPRFHGQSILFYSLETRKYHTFVNKDEMVNFHCAREKLNCGWIEPRWH